MSDMIEKGEWCSQSGFLSRDGKCRSPDGCFCKSIAGLHAQLADAKAAQAMVVARAIDEIDCGCTIASGGCRFPHACPQDDISAIRALADTDGLALVQALRAERDGLKQKLISPDPYEDTAHPDDHAVNRFAAAMKGKLAAKRLQGRGGWQEPEVPNGYLSRLLREHVDKGDPVDVANFAMMVHQRGERIAPENAGASCKAIDEAEADRDRLAAANAALEAQVARLVEVYWKLRSYAIHDDNCKMNKPPYKVGSCSCGLSKALKDGEIAALAAVQADARREGGK